MDDVLTLDSPVICTFCVSTELDNVVQVVTLETDLMVTLQSDTCV